jgi:hypothetical protein
MHSRPFVLYQAKPCDGPNFYKLVFFLREWGMKFTEVRISATAELQDEMLQEGWAGHETLVYTVYIYS